MDDNPRPNKRPRRNLAGTVAGVRKAPPKPKPIPRTPLWEDVYFVYTNKSDNKTPTEPWEDVLWDRADAFTELLRQWRANIRPLHNMYDVHKFNSHIEFIDNSDDEQVHLTYRVWKKETSKSPLQYVGHVRYRGSVEDGCGSVDIVTRDLTMEFPDAPPPTQKNNGKASAADQPTKRIDDPRLEKAVLAFMDDGNDRLYRVRLVTGHHEWDFKFEGRNTYFSARRTEVDDERAEATNATIEDLEAQQQRPSSEARPFHDTLFAIGEPPAQRRAKVIDSCGRNSNYTQIKEEEFREWTGRALFLSYNELRNSDTSEEGPDWYDGAAGNIIFNERFAGKLYYDGLPLSHWEVAPTDRNKVGLKHGYDIRKPSETAANYTILTPDAEVKVIGSIWHRAVVTHRTKATSALDRLLKTDPPSRDALAAIQYLSTELKDTRTIEDLWGELKRTKTASKKPPWYLPASFKDDHAESFIETQEKAGYEVTTIPDSYWSLFTILKSVRSPEQEMRRQASTRPIEPPAGACIIVSKEQTAASDAETALTQSSSPAASTRTSQEKTPVEASTVPSTEPSVERTIAAPGLDCAMLSKIKLCQALNIRRNPGLTMRESVPLEVSPLDESMSSPETVSKELLSDLFPGILHKLIQKLEAENQAQKARIAALEMEASERSGTYHPRDGDRMILDDDGSTNASRRDIAAQAVPDGVSAVTMDDSAEERVFPVPSDWFPNEVMRLVQACLALCPQPLNTYTCLPIEGGTGVVVAGFCRFDHDQNMLKIHKDWLSLDRMRLEFGSREDTTQADLLCHTVLTLWEDLLKTDAPSCLDKHGGHPVWARCRGEIRRRLLGYRQACRQITVPESLLKCGELTVVTSTLFTSGWAQDTDLINISVHYKDCPWARQNTRMADPLDSHFTDITAPKHMNENGNLITHAGCDSARFCHGVTNKGIATHPFFALKFRGLDYRKWFFVVAKNLSQSNSLVVVLEGHHTPLANHGAANANLESHVADYVARGFLVHPVFRGPRGSPGQLLAGLHVGPPSRPSELSATPEASPIDPVSQRLESLQRRVAEEQEKLAQLNAEIPPDPAGLQVALEVIDMLQKRIDQEQRKKETLSLRSALRAPPLPSLNSPLGPPPIPPLCGPSTRPPSGFLSGFRHPHEEHGHGRRSASLGLTETQSPSFIPSAEEERKTSERPDAPVLLVAPVSSDTHTHEPTIQAASPLSLPASHPAEFPSLVSRTHVPLPASHQRPLRPPIAESYVPKPQSSGRGSLPAPALTNDGQSPPWQPPSLRSSIEAETFEKTMEPCDGTARTKAVLDSDSMWKPLDLKRLPKEFLTLSGDTDNRNIDARVKVCLLWQVPSAQLAALFGGMVNSRAFMDNLARLAMSVAHTAAMQLLERTRRARRDPTRDPRVYQGVAIAPLWTVDDTTRALVEAGLTTDTSTKTPDSESLTARDSEYEQAQPGDAQRSTRETHKEANGSRPNAYEEPRCFRRLVTDKLRAVRDLYFYMTSWNALTQGERSKPGSTASIIARITPETPLQPDNVAPLPQQGRSPLPEHRKAVMDVRHHVFLARLGHRYEQGKARVRLLADVKHRSRWEASFRTLAWEELRNEDPSLNEQAFMRLVRKGKKLLSFCGNDLEQRGILALLGGQVYEITGAFKFWQSPLDKEAVGEVCSWTEEDSPLWPAVAAGRALLDTMDRGEKVDEGLIRFAEQMITDIWGPDTRPWASVAERGMAGVGDADSTATTATPLAPVNRRPQYPHLGIPRRLRTIVQTAGSELSS